MQDTERWSGPIGRTGAVIPAMVRPWANQRERDGRSDDKRDGDPAGYPDHPRAISDHVAHGAVRADLEQLFRRLLFNVLAGNRDDHLRNHGFLRLREGWRLAPAFDLNPARELREHALAVDGTTTAPNLPAAFATHRLYGLSEARGREIAREVDRAVSRWPDVARAHGISATEQATVGAVIMSLPTELGG